MSLQMYTTFTRNEKDWIVTKIQYRKLMPSKYRFLSVYLYIRQTIIDVKDFFSIRASECRDFPFGPAAERQRAVPNESIRPWRGKGPLWRCLPSPFEWVVRFHAAAARSLSLSHPCSFFLSLIALFFFSSRIYSFPTTFSERCWSSHFSCGN